MSVIGQLRCPCAACEGNAASPTVVDALMGKLLAMEGMLRNETGKEVDLYVTSGVRCAAHNASVGGAPDSQHLLGHAADLYSADSESHYLLVDAAISAGVPFIELAPHHIHVDLRPGPLRLITGAG